MSEEKKDFSFLNGLNELIESAVTDRISSLDERERVIEQREEKVDAVLKAFPSGIVTLNVGGEIFMSSTDILTSIQDTYFCGLLSQNADKVEAQEALFIPRCPVVFRHILDYLTYGEFDEGIQDPFLLKKLVVDADYYLLEELKSKLEAQLELVGEVQGHMGNVRWVSLTCNNCNPGSGTPYSFEVNSISSQADFGVNGTNVTVLRSGVYQISLKESHRNTGNGNYTEVRRNNNVISRAYRADANGYYNTCSFTEIWEFDENDVITVVPTYNTAPPANGIYYFQFSIMSIR
eukprot:TRINITY_DN1417_c0_g1_i1.p1 TRINITY_DN1417_c0_g1~~TRINITY_DN1417_c0_g1_i1.p1  ORF type:complete len:291 (-),score=62.73 TRINITY_DN1417_c0_g1_i1:24-896(-)